MHNFDNVSPTGFQYLWEHAPEMVEKINAQLNGGTVYLTEDDQSVIAALTNSTEVLIEKHDPGVRSIREQYEIFTLAKAGLVEDYAIERRGELVEFVERLDGGLTDEMITEINGGADPDDVLRRVNEEIEAAEDAIIEAAELGINIKTADGKHLVLNYLEQDKVDEYDHLKESDPDVYSFFAGLN